MVNMFICNMRKASCNKNCRHKFPHFEKDAIEGCKIRSTDLRCCKSKCTHVFVSVNVRYKTKKNIKMLNELVRQDEMDNKTKRRSL